jgi:hypothetical protein
VTFAAVLATAGLTACRTNVGTAATVNGHRITETQVNDYITPNAQPVRQQTGTMSPRSFVLYLLINERLGFAIAQRIPGFRGFSSARLDARLDADLAGKTPKQVAEGEGLKGYQESFYRVALRVQELSNIIQTARQQLGSGAVDKAIRTVHFRVSVNPRYGTWNPKSLSFNGSPAVPSYLSVAPGPAGQPG